MFPAWYVIPPPVATGESATSGGEGLASGPPGAGHGPGALSNTFNITVKDNCAGSGPIARI